MPCRWLIGTLALLLVGFGVSFGQDKKGSDKTSDKPATGKADKPRIPASAVPGYTVKKVRGFHLLISDETTGHESDEKYQLKPSEVLDRELAGVERVMPSRMLK